MRLKNLALALCALVLVVSPCFGESFEQNYPIGLISYAGYPYQLTVKQLLDKNNLVNTSNENGLIAATIESSSVKNGVLTLTLLCSVNGKSLMRAKISFKNDINAEVCTITYIYLTVLGTGQTTEIRYDGTQRTTGELVGSFVELVGIFYDQEKLKPKPKALR